ncbi:MAG TPA: hypothetical protein VMT00_05735 [Thermoanaerobaculia bacterium]|nr:hypothetical protein [Thermoanaerobaculia bacterium]
MLIWWGGSPSYNVALARSAEMVLRWSERPPVTRLRTEERQIIVERQDFARGSPRPGVPAHDLTFNFIIMMTLFAAGRETFSNRNVAGLLLAAAILFLTHVAGLIVTIKSIYALQLGAWSQANYGSVARNIWGAAAHFYRLVGMYAFAVGLWWLLRPGVVVEMPKGRSVRKRKSARS